MRIDGWQVDGFGVLKDTSEQGLDRGVTVLLGENEAGKSTLLAFIRAILYGFPRANARDERSYPPLNGGRHGGRLLLRDREDGLWAVSRYADLRDVEITRPDGAAADAADLDVLLGHTDRPLFKSVFAFGLEELQQFTTLTGEGVRDRIFSAGISGAGKSAREAIANLEKQQATLLKQGRGEAAINSLVKEIQGLDAQIAEARQLAARYTEFEQTAEEQETVAEELGGQADDKQRLRSEAQTLIKLRPEWQELEARRLELAGLPPVSDDSLPSSVSGAVTDLAVQRNQERRLQDLRVDQTAASDALRDSLARLGAGWDMARVDTVDVSIAARDEVRTWATKVSEAELGLTNTRQRREDGAEAAKQAHDAHDAVLRDLPEAEPLTIEQIDAGEAALSALRGDVQHLQLLRLQAEREAPAVASGFVAILVLAALAAVGAVASFVLGYVQLGAGLLVAAALACAAVAVMRRRPSPSADDAFAKPGVVVEAEEAIRSSARALGLPDTPTSQDMAAREADFKTQRTRRAEWTAVQARVNDARQRVEQNEGLLDTAKAKLETAEAEAARVAREWAEWLASRGLAGLSPDAVLAVMDEVETARRARKDHDTATVGVTTIERAAADWDVNAAKLLEAAGRPADGLSGEPLRSALVALDGDLIRRRELLAEVDGLARTIAVGLSTSRDAESAENELAAGDPGIWQDRAEQLGDEVLSLRAERDAAKTQVTEAHVEMRAIAESADIARLEGELASDRARLLELAREYKVVSVARSLVANTLSAYVRDRQPAVLDDGSAAFQTVTNGRYVRVQQDGEGALDSIVVIDRDGRRKSPDQLSTGTQQQLYLSIRLALASMFAGRSEPLPIVMDDCLVNFDPARAASLAALLAERSSDGQALLFTCHPETADLMRTQAAGPVRVVELSGQAAG